MVSGRARALEKLQSTLRPLITLFEKHPEVEVPTCSPGKKRKSDKRCRCQSQRHPDKGNKSPYRLWALCERSGGWFTVGYYRRRTYPEDFLHNEEGEFSRRTPYDSLGPLPEIRDNCHRFPPQQIDTS